MDAGVVTTRLCWTCNTEHDPDEACAQSATARSARAAGGNLSDLIDAARRAVREFGPVFTATYESECDACDGAIWPGEAIRADGRGGWIHADTECEKIASLL